MCGACVSFDLFYFNSNKSLYKILYFQLKKEQDWHRYGQPFWSVSVVIVVILIIRIHSFNGNLILGWADQKWIMISTQSY